METILGAALALLTLMAAGAFTWLRSLVGEQEQIVQALRRSVAELELGGARGMGLLELKLTEQLGAIRETLARILSRMDHYEAMHGDDRIDRTSRNQGRS